MFRRVATGCHDPWRQLPNGEQQEAGERERKIARCVLVEDEAELLVAFNRPRRGPFMYHCHILEHEDAGMMGQYVCA
jgi:FtsP/CotA-like multicopper oxidase with cupredoxin domain